MMINKKVLMLFFLLLSFLFTPIVRSQDGQVYPEYEQEWFWTIPAYAPAKVNINYVYTHNHSISDISCLGTTSLYRHSGGPRNIMFEAEDVDTYKYTIDLFYSEITAQRITVGAWSGTLQVPQESEYKFYTMHVTIHVTLLVTGEPKYPSAQETAEATLSRLEKIWVNYTRTLEEKVTGYEQLLLLHTIGTLVAVGMAVIAIIAAIKMSRRR